MGTELVNKISVKKICGALKPPIEKTALIAVYGIATGVKLGESHLGSWAALLGKFEATRLSDGEVFVSGTCFLPKIATDLIMPMLNRPGTDSLEFGFVLGIVPATNAYGYEYYVETATETTDMDPLEAIRQRVVKKLNSQGVAGRLEA